MDGNDRKNKQAGPSQSVGLSSGFQTPARQRSWEPSGKHHDLVGEMRTILFVDDEEMILEIGAAFLEKIGYTVLKANGGKEAVRLFKEYAYEIDLVVLDLVMPDMDGTDVFHEIRGVNPDAKVLFASGFNMDRRAQELLGQGSDAFIQKPFGMKEFFAKIRAVLEKE